MPKVSMTEAFWVAGVLIVLAYFTVPYFEGPMCQAASLVLGVNC